jgi:hypothetical protein
MVLVWGPREVSHIRQLLALPAHLLCGLGVLTSLGLSVQSRAIIGTSQVETSGTGLGTAWHLLSKRSLSQSAVTSCGGPHVTRGS